MNEGKLTRILQARSALEQNKNLATLPKGEGGYPKGEKDWDAYNSPIESFGTTFMTTMPEKWIEHSFSPLMEEEEILKDYIQSTLSNEKDHDLTAVEFGGPGSSLFNGFKKGFFKKTVGVCLKDIRETGEKVDDEKIAHSVVEGDVVDPLNLSLISKIQKTLEAKQIDLIISRMMGPLVLMNRHESIMDRIIRNWYAVLSENGLMFVQFAGSNGKIETQKMVENWSKIIGNKFPEVDIQTGQGVLRLHKRIGSPEILPPATQLF